MTAQLADLVAPFLAEMADSGVLGPRTLDNYRSELWAAARTFPMPLDDIDVAALDQFVLRDGVAPGTVTRRHATLRRFFAWAAQAGWCTTEPLATSTVRRPLVSLPRPIPPAERAALDAALAARLDDLPVPYALLLAILRETGVRPHEALALRRSDVSVTPGVEVLRIWTPQRDAVRLVPLRAATTPHTLRLLRTHVPDLGRLSTVPVAQSPRGGAVSYDALQYQWAKLCAVAGLATASGTPRYTLQQLRATCGCELIAQGVPVDVVQRLLGHRDPRSTRGYHVLATATGVSLTAPADVVSSIRPVAGDTTTPPETVSDPPAACACIPSGA